MRIGVLTGGGDAPGTNAVLRALTRALILHGGAQVIGLEDGYLGLMEGRTRPLDLASVESIGPLGGTVLGSTNRASPLDWHGQDCRAQAVAQARALGLDGLVAIGGDGTLTIAQALHRAGLPTVGIPKTIDNDIQGVDQSFGFDTAVARAAEAIDRVHTTADSMGRVMLVETMGRHAGWIALESGLASAADIILLPEIGYTLEAVARVCAARRTQRHATVICVAEGAHARGAGETVRARVEGAPDPVRLGGVAERLAVELQQHLDCEARAVVLGHVQRGGSPSAGDRILSTLYGDAAARLVAQGTWGQVVTYARGRLAHVPLEDVAGPPRRVPEHHPLLDCARRVGVGFGEPEAAPGPGGA